MDRIVARFRGRVPLLANMVEGGTTPIRTLDELSESGFDLVITPGALVRAYVHMAAGFLEGLKRTGSTKPQSENMVDFAQLNGALGMAELTRIGERYDPLLRLDVYRQKAN
jgi:2-methylisocitrate lyase-like PEP mutase family enzyme